MKIFKHGIHGLAITIGFLACILSPQLSALAADDTESVIVNVDNFVRAETAAQFDRGLKMVGGQINKIVHFRAPTPIDRQNIIRMNRDTLYSGAIVDISKGATLTIPDTGSRYLSAMVINEDHYINKVYHDPGTYKLTMDEFHTPYVMIGIRILADASDPALSCESKSRGN